MTRDDPVHEAASESAHEALRLVADAVARLSAGARALVGIDGVDGAGKTTFADQLALSIDRPVVRASCDDFHHPRAHRYRRGRESPEGFYLDSFDSDALTELLLAPFSAGRRFRRRAFDHLTDQPVSADVEDAPAGAVLVLDGLFLHSERLRRWWDLSVLLDVPPDVAAARLLQRDGVPTRQRYVRGQELYFADADPRRQASFVLAW
jgi:uridine kinase